MNCEHAYDWEIKEFRSGEKRGYCVTCGELLFEIKQGRLTWFVTPVNQKAAEALL